MSDQRDDLTDLEWQAFCYAMDEMDAEERAAWEETMASSQEARETLARIVQLCQLIEAAESTCDEPLMDVPRSHAWRTMLQRAAMALAAALLVALLFWWSGPKHWWERLAERRASSDVGETEHLLADAWLEMRAAAPVLTTAAFLYEGETADMGVDEQGPAATPEWLRVAVEDLNTSAPNDGQRDQPGEAK